MKGFKGFDKDLKCRDFQFEVGGEYEEKEARTCRRGFHFCENPLDVFNYYPPANSRYAEVEGDGQMDTDTDDSKVACTRLRVGAEIGINGLLNAGVKFILDRVKWDEAKESSNEDNSAATNTGYQSAATNTGNRSAATNTGDYSAATNTGYQSAATVEGKESIAVATGYEGKAKGALGCWLVLAEWERKDGEYHIKDVQSTRVDGEKIKANVFYSLVNGKFIECDS